MKLTQEQTDKILKLLREQEFVVLDKSESNFGLLIENHYFNEKVNEALQELGE